LICHRTIARVCCEFMGDPPAEATVFSAGNRLLSRQPTPFGAKAFGIPGLVVALSNKVLVWLLLIAFFYITHLLSSFPLALDKNRNPSLCSQPLY